MVSLDVLSLWFSLHASVAPESSSLDWFCAAGNHQMCLLGQQQRSLLCPFDLPVRYHRGDLFEHVHYVQVSPYTIWRRNIKMLCGSDILSCSNMKKKTLFNHHRGKIFQQFLFHTSSCFSLCSQFGEEVSVASSVALVSERNPNQTAASPQLHPSVSGDQDPAAALWGSRQDYTQAG